MRHSRRNKPDKYYWQEAMVTNAPNVQRNKPKRRRREIINWGHTLRYNWHPKVECIDVAEDFPFVLGTAIKYIWRMAANVQTPERNIEDAQKAIKYLERYIHQQQTYKFPNMHHDRQVESAQCRIEANLERPNWKKDNT